MPLSSLQTDECIYVLHGFASAPKYPSIKEDVLKRVFEMPVKQLCYDSAGLFQDNMAALKEQVDITPLFFVGTSLGAFYASKLAELFYEQNAMPIMLNPCHNPVSILRNKRGKNDELINAKETKLLYENDLALLCFEHGAHRFENISTHEVISVLEQINNSYFIHGVCND